MRALLICVLALAPILAAQSYTVTNGTISGGYTDLSGPTPSNLANGGTITSAISPTGFSFTYFGTAYSSFKLSASGAIIMGSSGTALVKYPAHGNAPGLVICPDWDYLFPGSYLMPATSPTMPAPGRCNYTWSGGILAVEWRNVPVSGTGPVGVRMKAILNTGTGEIEFHYGSVPSGCTGSCTGLAHSAAISSPSGGTQEIVDATISGYINSTGGITAWPVDRYVRFTPVGTTPVNSAPTIAVMQSSNTIGNGGSVNVNHNIPVSALFFAITANDADGDPVSVSTNISNLGSTGIPISEWQSGSASVPYTLQPSTGTFNTNSGVTHTVTLTADDGQDQTVFTFDIVQAAATPTPSIGVSDGASVSAGQGATGTNRDFGSLDITAGASAPVTITINNGGSGMLSLGTISMTGDSTHFLLDTSMTSANVTGGGNTMFTIEFDPTSAGQKIAQVTFTHNDSAVTSPFTFEVTGLGTSVTPLPLLVVRETNVSGTLIANGASASGIRMMGSHDLAAPMPSMTIFVQNSGTATLTLGTPASTDSDFTVNAGSFPSSLLAGTSATFTVTFSPATVGTKSANIQFTHNDASTPTPFSFQVTGTATSTGGGPGPGGIGGNGGGGGGGGCGISNSSYSLWLLIIALGASLGARTLRRRAR